MGMKSRILLSGMVLMTIYAGNAFAQTYIADSLKNVLNKSTRPEIRAITLSHLARCLYETDMTAAIRYANEAIQLGNTFTDGQYKAFGFATLTYLNGQRDSLLLAQRSIDSALFYTQKSSNRVINGYAWLRKGWLELILNNTGKAMEALQRALQLLEGQGAYDYESLTYHYLASIHADLKDADKLANYTQLSTQLAYKSNNPDIICNAYVSLGSSFLQKFRKDRSKKAMLDSALYYNNRLLHLANASPDRIVNHINVAAAALNTAVIYWEFFPKTFKDSAEKYINVALNIARRTKHEEVIANCYGILSEYAIAEGDYASAEKLFQMGLAEVESSANSSKKVIADMMKGLATVAEKNGDKARALHYFKEYTRFEQEHYNVEKLAIAQRIEAQFESEKKDRDLEILQQQASFNRRLNFIYIGLVIASLLALIFLFISYHFRLKSSLQQQKLRAEEAARLKVEQELMQEKQLRLQKELLAGSLQVEEKNEMLNTLRDQLAIQTENTTLKKQVEKIIRENDRMDEDLEMVKSSLTEIHPEFFTRLQEKANNTLTRLDMKYCSYILMGLSNKEIANRLGVDPKSIRMARYRIKQKLRLDKEDNLDTFLRTLG